MVSFRPTGSSKRLEVPASEGSSTSSGSSAVEAAGPPTPDGGEAATGAAAAASSRSKFWPTQAEVDAVLLLLSAEDREACDAAMTNRCALGAWVRRGAGAL